MFHLHRIRAALWTAAATVLFVPTASVAQEFSDRDSREIASYMLTESALAKYARATANLGANAKGLSGHCDDDGDDDGDDDESARSLDEMVARINAKPGISAAIQSAGMTTREYVVFSLSLFQNGMAAWALSQPGGKLPPEISKANVDFYRAHEAAIQKLGSQEGSNGCDDSDSEDEEAVDEEERAE